MKRREFIALIGSTATWPLVAHARQPAMPVIGFLGGVSPTSFVNTLPAFRNGLQELGFLEGRDIKIEYRWAEGQYDRLPALAVDLLKQRVAAIVAFANAPALAVKAATTTTPIVFAVGGDPVKLGLVVSLNRPGGNATGVTWLGETLVTKRIALLRQLVPAATTIGFLVNPNSPTAQADTKEVQIAARTLGLQVDILNASAEDQIEVTLSHLQRIDALIVAADTFLSMQRQQILAATARFAKPAIYTSRSIAEAGGLMSYGANFLDAYRQAGIYTGRVLKGEKPGDLPVVQSSKFEFVINLKTAKTLGLTVPLIMQMTADEVIE